MKHAKIGLLLLTVLLFFICSVSHADGIALYDFDMNTYNEMLTSAKLGRGIVESIYELYYKQLEGLSEEERYQKLAKWSNSIILDFAYSDFIAYCAEYHAEEHLICTCTTPRPYEDEAHDVGCPWHRDNTIKTLSISGDGYTVTLHGKLPYGATATVQAGDESIVNPHGQFVESEISVYDCVDIVVYDANGDTWQPALGDLITISLPAAQMGMENGDEYTVMHYHSGEFFFLGHSTVTDGMVAFDTDGFSSFVTVSGKTGKIYDVKSVYPMMTTDTSTNGKVWMSGLYTDSNDHLYAIIEQKQDKQVISITVDGNKTTLSSSNSEKNTSGLTKLEFYEHSGDITAFSNLALNGKLFYIVDLGVCQFDDAVICSITTSAGGFDIDGVTFELTNKLSVDKSIVSVDGSTSFNASNIAPGSTVRYQLTASHTGTVALSGGKVLDALPTLPSGLSYQSVKAFDASGNQISFTYDSDGRMVLDSNLNLSGTSSKTYYVEVTYPEDLPQNVTEYKCTNMMRVVSPTVTKEAEADLTIKDPSSEGKLKVIKSVSGTTNTSDSFIFQVTGDGYSVFLTLKAGEDKVLTDLPTGDYTVTELTDWSSRYTPTASSQIATVEADETTTVTFTNAYTNDKLLGDEASKKNTFGK